MFERPLVVPLAEKNGTVRRCGCAKRDGIGECQSMPGERFNLLLSEGADLFVSGQIRPGTSNQRAIADWLARSPCHECAWRRLHAAWDVVPALPRKGYGL